MITSALKIYSQRVHPVKQFFEIVSKFQKMTSANLTTLSDLIVNPVIDVFLDLLPKDVPTDFAVF